MGFGNKSKEALGKPAISCALPGLGEPEGERRQAQRRGVSDGVGMGWESGPCPPAPVSLETLTPAAGHVADKTGSLQKSFKPQAKTKRPESILKHTHQNPLASRCLVLSSVFRYKSHPSTNSLLCSKHLVGDYWQINASHT